MSDKPSPIDEINQFLAESSEFQLVPRLDENQNHIGYDISEDGENIYKLDTLDEETAATQAMLFYDGFVNGNMEKDEWITALNIMGRHKKLKNLRASRITAIPKPTLDELNGMLLHHRYRVRERPEPWDGDIRGFVLEDFALNKVSWFLESDDEELVCMLVNILFYGLTQGQDAGKLLAMRGISQGNLLRQWSPPKGKMN